MPKRKRCSKKIGEPKAVTSNKRKTCPRSKRGRTARDPINWTVRFLLGPNAQFLIPFLEGKIGNGELLDGKIDKTDVLRKCIVCPFRNFDFKYEKEMIPRSDSSQSVGNSHVCNAPCASAKIENPYKKCRNISQSNVSEPFHSIVDRTISSLLSFQQYQVRKQEQLRGKELTWLELQKYTNLLSLGYEFLSDAGKKVDARSCQNIPGVVCRHLNSTVSFIKEHKSFHLLHGLIGDSMMFELLKSCYILIPVKNNRCTNYIQLCGPPLRGTSKSDNNKTDIVVAPSVSSGFVPRHLIFYNEKFSKSVGLPKSHQLMQRSSTPFELLDIIFNIRFQKGKEKKVLRRRLWKRLEHKGVVICQQILQKSRNLNFHRVLEKYCPLPSMHNRTGAVKVNNSNMVKGMALHEVVNKYSSSKMVVAFITNVLQRIFPTEFFGSRENFAAISTTIDNFIHMRRFERMPYHELMKNISVTKFSWLEKKRKSSTTRKMRSSSDHEEHSKLVLTLLSWLFQSVIIPLIRSNFYATETEHMGKRVVYYRKQVWCHIRKASLNCLLSNQFVEIKKVCDLKERLERQHIGLAKLRLLPKQNGIRPIATLSKRLSVEDIKSHTSLKSILSQRSKSYCRSTNSILQSTFDVLKYEYRIKPDSFGSGILGSNQLHPMLNSFLNDVRAKRPGANLYYACADIRRCFDKINQGTMLDIVCNIISQGKYLSQKHTIIHPFQSLQKVHVRHEKIIVPILDFQPHRQVVDNLDGSYYGTIFIDGAKTCVITKERVLNLLREHIMSNLVALSDTNRPHILCQIEGIPQGSVVSSYLCNYYYGYLEKQMMAGVFPSLEEDSNPYLFARIIDDFLCISTDKNVCIRFLNKLYDGCKGLGIEVNTSKTRTSFDVTLRPKVGPPIFVEKCAGDQFPWCGILFDIKSCETRVNYRRFEGTRARDDLTVDRIKEGRALKKRMTSFIRPRCQTIFYDSLIVSNETAEINFYQAVMLTAVKAMAYLGALPGKVSSNKSYVCYCIDDVILYGFSLIRRRLIRGTTDRMGDEKRGNSLGRKNIGSMSQKKALWLGRHSFQHVLQKSTTKDYAEIIHYLNCKLCNSGPTYNWRKVAYKASRSFSLERFDMVPEKKERKLPH